MSIRKLFFKAWGLIFFFLLQSHFLWCQTNKIYSPKIASLQVISNGNWLNSPIINLNSKEFINIEFDDFSSEYHRYTYTIEHCDWNWNVSSNLFPSDYLDGFYNDNEINNYRQSVNTNVEYIHYTIQIPNQTIKFKLSGNYKLSVYDQQDSSNKILEVYFMLLDQKSNVEAEVTGNTIKGSYNKYQEVSFSINYQSLQDLSNPAYEIKSVVLQNWCWENAVKNPKATFVTQKCIKFTQNKDLVFDGLNEFYKFDIKNVNAPALGVENITWDGISYNAYLWPNEERSNYIFDKDADGKFYIPNNSDNNINDNEYINVHFKLLSPQYKDKEVYLYGLWCNSEPKEKYLMKYDSADQSYNSIQRLRQGYYSYRYVTEDNGHLKQFPPEDNFFQTENEYQILVYYKNRTSRTDELIGYKTFKYDTAN